MPAVAPAVSQPRQSVRQPAPATGTRTLTQEKLAKLRSQLDVVQGNVQVMSEMLIAVTPGEENPDDRELLKVMFYGGVLVINGIVLYQFILIDIACDFERLL